LVINCLSGNKSLEIATAFCTKEVSAETTAFSRFRDSNQESFFKGKKWLSTAGITLAKISTKMTAKTTIISGLIKFLGITTF